MAEVKQAKQAPSLTDELQSTVDDILAKTTLADTSKAVSAAEALGIDPASLQVVGKARNIEQLFADAIEPIKAALSGFIINPTRDDIAKMVKANELLDKLIAISGARAEIKAKDILKGFKKHDEGVIELTLPHGTTIQEAGELLNAAAREKRMKRPVFDESRKGFWKANEADDDHATFPGRTYQFRIATDSASKTRAEQVRDHGEGAPLGAIVIAEACERLNSFNLETLFKNANGDKVWVHGSNVGVDVRGMTDGFVISSATRGVTVYSKPDDLLCDNTAFAATIPVRSPK